MTDLNDKSLEQEMEALAQFDRIRADFVQASPTDEAELIKETEEAAETGMGLGDSYADETILAAGAASEDPAEAQPEQAAVVFEDAADTAAEAAEEEIAPAVAAAAELTQEIPVQEDPAPAEETAGAAAAAEAAAGAAETKKMKKEKKAKEPKEKKGKAKKEKKKKKHVFGKIILGLFLFIIFVGIVGAGVAGYYAYQVIKDTPEINPSNIYEILSESSVMYDSKGNLITNLYESGGGIRANVDYDEMPENLKNAFLAVEDKTFWDHNGFNLVRIFGAIWDVVKSGMKGDIRGTSTISQQLARNVFLPERKEERTMVRKIQEAYYTVIIERSLSKEQILEAYLNTVYLGYNCNGVGAAAKSYFDKDVKDLNLIECATLAALPQNPNKYAPLKREYTSLVKEEDNYDIVSQSDLWTIYYNNAAEDRTKLVLSLMHDQGKIDDISYETAKNETIRPYLKPGMNVELAMKTTYISDYVIDQVLADLQKYLKLSYADAYDLLYTGGLIIETTIDPDLQDILDEEYTKRENFPKLSINRFTTDKDKNILSDDRKKVMLYNKSVIFNEDGGFIIPEGEFERLANGDVKFFKNNRLNIYRTVANEVEDVSVYIKDYYFFDSDGYLFSVPGSYWNIARKYKSRDEEGNLIISASFLADYPNALKMNDDGSLTLHESLIVEHDPVIQPQSAMCIVENETGYLRAMIGGREIEGSLLFNRATATRQTGSSIKPIAVYGPALQLGYENSLTGEGPIFTAGYVLEDSPIKRGGSLWPRNASGSYGGLTTLRNAIVNSINT